MQGRYSEVSALLIVFYALLASIRVWARPRLVPLYLAAAPFALEDYARYKKRVPVYLPWKRARLVTLQLSAIVGRCHLTCTRLQ